jgi:hypothetical protein
MCAAVGQVAMVKERVKERVPGAERMVFGGKDLPDHATLAECGVARDSTLDALPRCRGGAPTAAGGVEAYSAEHLATVRRELDLMRHLSQEMGARVARLQVCLCSLFPSGTMTSTPCSIAHARVIRKKQSKISNPRVRNLKFPKSQLFLVPKKCFLIPWTTFHTQQFVFVPLKFFLYLDLIFPYFYVNVFIPQHYFFEPCVLFHTVYIPLIFFHTNTISYLRFFPYQYLNFIPNHFFIPTLLFHTIDICF